MEAIDEQRALLAKAKKDIAALVTFEKSVNAQWGDIACRNIGHVDWAPEISVDVEDDHYTGRKHLACHLCNPHLVGHQATESSVSAC